jgi:hypothetical protein
MWSNYVTAENSLCSQIKIGMLPMNPQIEAAKTRDPVILRLEDCSDSYEFAEQETKGITLIQQEVANDLR